ncbi:MAG: biopolymer transport protein ExbD [Verrucomicrobiales bacterium]|jgi:biopolymer transport protein ExbD
MRIKSRQKESSGGILNISSLVDVLFILIIFYVAASTFKEEERDIRVSLPNALAGETLSQAASVLVVNVREDDSVTLGRVAITLNQLAIEMAEIAKKNPSQKVLIRGDERAMHGTVAGAVFACKRAGIDEANIGYQLPR